MMKSALYASLAGFAAAECHGSPCSSIASTRVSRFVDEESEIMTDPVLSTNTFTAVDTCATDEVKSLTSWVLSYYSQVSEELDESFSNILTTARLANSALRHLSSLSMELQAYTRAQNISSEMNAMLRTCLADAMHLSASMERCDMSFSQQSTNGFDSLTPNTNLQEDGIFLSPITTNGGNTCLASICEHTMAWNTTCGSEGFAKDLAYLSASHELSGSTFQFPSAAATQLHQAPTQLYMQNDNSKTYEILVEDALTMEASLLRRTALWLDAQFNAMMVMTKKALNGGGLVMSSESDLDTCAAIGYPVEAADWLHIAFGKCNGGLVSTSLKVTQMNRKFLVELANKMKNKIQGVIQSGKGGEAGTLYAGPLTNMCAQYNDIAPEIQAEVERLSASYQQVHGNLGKKVDTFYLNKVSAVNTEMTKSNFNQNTGPTENFYMAGRDLQSPFAAVA